MGAALNTIPRDDTTIIDYAHRGDAEGETIRIQKTGSVLGNVKARTVWIAGRVDGDIDADEVFVGKSARIRGTIRYRTIGISPGGSVTGSMYRILVDSPVVTEKPEPQPAIERLSPQPRERRMKPLPGLIA